MGLNTQLPHKAERAPRKAFFVVVVLFQLFKRRSGNTNTKLDLVFPMYFNKSQY